MNLLFDQNISFRIIKKIEPIFPGCQQVHMLGLTDSSDHFIWEYARKNNCCIVTFDSDFIDISVLRGYPPKIIWLRLGNTSTDSLASRVIAEKDRIEKFLADAQSIILQIG